MPREAEGSAEILHEVRLGFSTYVALVDADNQARTGSRFLGHFDGMAVGLLSMGGMGRKSPVRKSAAAKSFRTSAVGVGADARPEGGLPDCGEGATNRKRVVLALPRFITPSQLPYRLKP